MTRPASYYPPRARWYAPLLNLGDSLRRRLALDRIASGASVPIPLLAISLFVPGFACFLRWPRTWGKAMLATCALLGAVFFGWLGHPIANLAFGGILSVHVTGITSLFEARFKGEPLRSRVMFSMAILAILGLALYLPFRNLLEEYWLLPLRMDGKVVVINRLASPGAVHRGDWVAYSMHAASEYQVVVRAGLGLGRVDAVAGDQVRFTLADLEVNGVPIRRAADMPAEGEIQVPANHWFIWPHLNSTIHGNVARQHITAALVSAAIVSEGDFLGVPFKRWCWRKQV